LKPFRTFQTRSTGKSSPIPLSEFPRKEKEGKTTFKTGYYFSFVAWEFVAQLGLFPEYRIEDPKPTSVPLNAIFF
jgi:hypothetical protein